MKVALVLASSTGGIGRHVRSLADGLLEEGVDVTVCGPAATGELFGFPGFVPVDVSPRAAAPLRRVLTAVRPDVVHAHGLRAGLVSAAARRDTTPLVVTWHNAVLAGGLRGRAYGVAERYVARSADVNLGASADLVARSAALGARDARLAPVAAPPLPAPARTRAAVRAELGVVADTPLILSVGRLHPQKGYETLIEAATGWRASVVIAGTGPSYMRLAALVSTTRAPVTLLGHRNDVADLLAAADIAVVTSVWEARQLFAQEAMTAGVALVATDVGGIPGLVGDAALLVRPGDVAGLDEAVTGLLDDPALRDQYAAAGRIQAKTWPTEQETVRQVLDVYRELVG